MNIPFNKPYQSPKALEYIGDAMDRGHLSGNGYYSLKCQRFFENRYNVSRCLLTSSCTDALEMAAILLDIQPGDEVIMPSFTFVSTANAFVLRGAKLRFVDSRSDHPGMDETKVEELINEKTKVIVAVHYAGVACDMGLIMGLARKYDLFVVEDAAHGVESDFLGEQLGTIGHLGAMSFHETKNIQCGMGGMLMINDSQFLERAEIIWNRGTDKANFQRGAISKYQWTDIGSSYQLSEVNAAILWSQLEELEEIVERRKGIWDSYFNCFSTENFESPATNCSCISAFKFHTSAFKPQPSDFSFQTSKFRGNCHIFYLLFNFKYERDNYSQSLRDQGIMSVFHYQSLHKSPFAQQHFPEEYERNLPNSERYSDCLLRLPMFYEMGELIEDARKLDTYKFE